MREIVMKRQLKAKPGLKDMIMEYVAHQDQKDEKIRNKIKQKVLNVYEMQIFKYLGGNDIWYNRIVLNCDRMMKMLQMHTAAINNVEIKLNQLTTKKKRTIKKLIRQNVRRSSTLQIPDKDKLESNPERCETPKIGMMSRISESESSAS